MVFLDRNVGKLEQGHSLGTTILPGGGQPALYGCPKHLSAQTAPGQALLQHLNNPLSAQAVAQLSPSSAPQHGLPKQASPHHCDVGPRYTAPAPQQQGPSSPPALLLLPTCLPVPFMLLSFIPFLSRWAEGHPGGYLKRGVCPGAGSFTRSACGTRWGQL